MSGLFKAFLIFAIFVAVLRLLKRGFAGSDAGREQRSPGPRRPPAEPLEITVGPESHLSPWPRFAADLGLTYTEEHGPQMAGQHAGIDVVVLTDQLGSGTTSAVATLSSPGRAALEVYRALESERGEDLVATGNRDFDTEFVTICRWPSFARRILDDPTRSWMLALEDAELSVTKSRAVATTPRHEENEDRLRALIELAAEAARRAVD